MSQTFEVTGLHCQSCVRVVTEALTELPAVNGVEIDLDAEGTSVVRVDGDITVEQVRAALADEDYTVVG
ncbi:heavy-metal-associated domain-containing protein [Mycobacterium crocinum]|uniref:Heavy-metal-associated domain-containing protein n=2 Tax=Mycolicibacterium TaxID=1866885 RepID=A0ABX8VMA5_9MYCO|nr:MULTISPECIES: heavy-metal-associated domain-containing protein [Mycolicibacterium]APE15637.1 heavy metal transporter [Mycobacterium sp. WY10]MCV7219055.1 heavy-metal-associated domain-containing protein [Mycolicibacterium crocinum]QYL18929.1 heavy-metal-associated domain-containing protein [Mycolicibacterium pallens]ULN43655.1 heavy-metal-associated domain-containing protein [Mycolicibacterium crocinum]